MPRYSEEWIEEVRGRNDIVDVIGMHVNLKRQGSNYMGLCPFHSEKSPSFSVSRAKQMYYCFGCHVGGNVITFVEEYENYSFTEAMAYLAERVGMEVPKAELSVQARQEENEKHRLLEIHKQAASYYYSMLKSQTGKWGYEYLSGRGLTDETILHFGLGYSGKGDGSLYRYLQQLGYEDELLKKTGLFTMREDRGVSEKFWNRVMFPIMDVNNRVIGFGGRTMGDGKPKYLNSPETKIFDKSRNLYGLNYARTSREKQILLCEGYMDVIALHQAGFTNAVASLGTAFTGLQANLIKRYAGEVLLTYDSDDAGVNAALRAIPILKQAGLIPKIVNMKPYKDPDEFIKNLGAEEFARRLEQAENAFFFEIRMLERGYDTTDPEAKTRFQREMAKKLLQFEEELERNNYIEALSGMYHIRSEDLTRMVNRMGNEMLSGKPATVFYEQNRGEDREKRSRTEDTGMFQSYRLLFTWLVEKPELYGQIQKIFTPEDFIGEPYHQVAEMLFAQFDASDVVPAKIVSRFEDSDKQAQVAEIFNTPFQSRMTTGEQERALNELIRRIKEYGLEQRGRTVTDVAQLQKLIKEKAEIGKMHISLKDG